MPFSRLESLPDELLSLILQHLPSPSDLHPVCLVSKNLNRLATTHLYTHISLSSTSFRHLRPLALLFWTSPPHRNAVRSLSVRHAYGGDLEPWPSHPRLDEIIRENLNLYVRSGDRDEWFGKVREGGGDAVRIASLVLRSLPFVARMQLEGFELVDPKVREGGGVIA